MFIYPVLYITCISSSMVHNSNLSIFKFIRCLSNPDHSGGYFYILNNFGRRNSHKTAARGWSQLQNGKLDATDSVEFIDDNQLVTLQVNNQNSKTTKSSIKGKYSTLGPSHKLTSTTVRYRIIIILLHKERNELHSGLRKKRTPQATPKVPSGHRWPPSPTLYSPILVHVLIYNFTSTSDFYRRAPVSSSTCLMLANAILSLDYWLMICSH